MKNMKNLASTFTLALAALVSPLVVRAADPAPGIIYSVDLVEDVLLGGKIPSETEPLKVSDKVVVRMRLINADYMTAGKPWRVVERVPGASELYPLQLGFMFGGKQVYADFVDTRIPEATRPNAYTDLYFEYVVRPGDLALPAYLMNNQGKVAGNTPGADYALTHANLWLLTNDAGADPIVQQTFHFAPDTGAGTYPEVPGQPRTYYVSGYGMGLYVQTVDFDDNYFKPAVAAGDEAIWRRIPEGSYDPNQVEPMPMTLRADDALSSLVRMYVWVADEDKAVLQPLDSESYAVSDTVEGATVTRQVLPVEIKSGSASATFKLMAMPGMVGKKARIRMSSSEHLMVDDFSKLVTNWVERTVLIGEKLDAFASLAFKTPTGELTSSVSCAADYKPYAAVLEVTLSEAPTAPVTVTVGVFAGEDDVTEDVCPSDMSPESAADRRLTLSTSGDETDMPWGDRDLSVEFKTGETTKRLYLYAFDQTTDLATKLEFRPVLSGAGAAQYIGAAKSAALAVTGIAPVIVSPTAEDAITDAMAGEEYPLEIVVADSLRNVSRTGWAVWYKSAACGDTKWHSLTDGVNPDEDGIITAPITFSVPGDKDIELYVKAPDGRDSRIGGKGVKIPLHVEEAKRAWAELDREDGLYAESPGNVMAKVKFFISQPSENGKDLYAFLRPLNDDATNCFSCAAFTTTPQSQSIGVPIPGGKTDSGALTANIELRDGRYPMSMGIFEVVLCSGTSKYKKTAEANYSAGQVYINMTNVCPRIEGVTVGGVDLTVSGSTLPNAIAQDVSKVFRVSIGNTEPSRVDLEGTLAEGGTPGGEGDNRYYTQWKFGNGEWGSEICGGTLYGDPNQTTLEHTFVSPGEQTVRVRVQDKDMRTQGIWSEEFTFKVNVLNVPAIEITPVNGNTYNESDTGENASRFNVSLTAAPEFTTAGDTLDVELTVEKIDPSGAYGTEGCVLSKQLVQFRSGVKEGQYFYLSELDGTPGSAAKGYRIWARATPESMAKDSELKTWDAGSVEISVVNVNPTILTPAEILDSEGKPIAQVTTVGTKIQLAWAISDVLADNKAMSVTWTTSEGKSKRYVQGTGTSTDEVEYRDDVMSGTHEFDFNSSGEKSITILVQDKDGGIASRTLYYTIAASKTMEMVPHGPSGGNGTPLSSRYTDKANGLGAGRIWADNEAKFENWVHKFNCGLATEWRVFAQGYTNGQEDAAADYAYVDEEGRDSFLYAWLQIVKEEDKAKPTDEYLAVSPEHRGVPSAGTLVGLPTEQAEDGSYQNTSLEAIFSRERYWFDNMGDINQDGVPDIYVKGYCFNVFDTEGNVAGDDLAPITASASGSGEGATEGQGNIDGDYLPSGGTSILASLIPGLKESWVKVGVPFDAVTEIRGYHAGLNDAPQQAPNINAKDVKAERIYEVADADGNMTWDEQKCTISYLEYVAWKVSGLPADKWSPERPSDPTKADTDDDGIEDGYEYYFWYRAHVGYFDAKGRYRRLTGRRYDPRNPGEGVLITPEQIEAIMDPLVPNKGESAETRDTDNDGLPDKLEFELGTNPFDFDTDGDGLADGWELMIAGLDPLLAGSSADAKVDGERNYDGDAMAISSFQLEKAMKPVPYTSDHAKRFTFAVLDENGDTDGVQWYAALTEPVTATQETSVAAWSFKAEGRTYVVYGVEPKKYDDPMSTNKILAVTYPKGFRDADGVDHGAFLSGDVTEYDEPVLDEEGNPVPSDVQALDEEGNPMTDPTTGDPIYVPLTNHIAVAERGYPVRVEAGVAISDVKEGVQPIVLTIGEEIDARTINAAWIYGRGAATNLVGDVAKTAAEYGCLALGRHQAPAQGAVVCAAVSDERDVAFLHYLCYQEFGFDPRTAWKAKDPLATRWSKSIDGQAVEGITTLRAGGFTGAPARTRDYTTYDEFLVCSFFENNGCDMSGFTYVIDDEAPAMARYWGAFTTNPQGKDEPGLISAEHYYGRNSDNGADTDLDGVPDGWELYVMSGPKNADGTYVFAPAYAGFAGALSGADYPLPQSYFSPFLSFAQKTETSNQVYLGGQINDDLMNEYQEFEGTDTMAYYADLSDTVVHTGEWKWFNKFFPTDPWSKDTDGDGIDDKSEGAVFVYGTPADDGKLWSIPGGGLNPCSVDTDQDGLPDPWERQFKGHKPYTEEIAKKTADGTVIIDFAKDETGAPIGNALQGLTDGMDGTVADAFSYPADKIVTANGFRQVVNRDYDRDGLENWQEYMTGTMRCWRYDDPYSPWVSIPTDWYFSKNAAGELSWNPRYDKFGLEQDDFNGFWYMTLVDDKSPYYNPHLITDQNQGAQYFSPVTNGWDVAYDSWQLNGSTRYYWFYNRVGGKMIKDYWVGPGLPPGPLAVCLSEGMRMEPTKYCSCSPIEPDSDFDGMDDYYELFHGMNPLLGESGVPLSSQGPCDLVFDAWYIDGAGALEAWGKDATMNYWQQNLDKLPRMPRGNGYDFVVFPWLNGAAGADPDGDDIRNDEESIMARVAPSAAWHHTDPTPLWMTDSSYTNSLVRQYFRIPAGLGDVKLDLPFFVHDETKFFFRDFDGFVDKSLTTKGMVIDPYAIETFGVDQWSVAGEGLMNWMYSFEENEGFDTDHDGLSDHEELESKFRAGTDPQDADSPRRRQAMYFQGKDRPSALQTLPFVEELHPVGATSYPQDMSFLQYTVECWAMPESLDDATLVERAVYTGESNPGDEEFMRKNFQLGIREGKWYTKFDPNGTLADNAVEVLSALPATAGAWTHLAATYDGTFLTLYVNGKAEKPARSGLQPSNGSSAVALLPDQSYWFDREYPLQAIVVGASFKTNGDGMPDGGALDVTQGWGWDRYTGFYKGYVDEIRVWDGVRTEKEIGQSMNVRFTAEDAKQNREKFYGKWSQGLSRYAKDSTGKDVDVLAELRFHWTFDSVFGAENEKAVAKVPHGFGPEGLKAPVSRPDDYGVAWYGQVLFGGDGKPGYAGAVYDDPLWVTWIPNTVTHLPRFDGTTLDSTYWSDDFRGDVAGVYAVKHSAEPASRWTQMVRNGVSASTQYWSTDARHQLVYSENVWTNAASLYEFAGRNRNQTGDDLIPLGGAFVKYVPGTPGLWDKQGASSVWELAGGDADSDGLPDWWEVYAEQNYREGVDPTKPISWSEPLINYNGIMTTPGEAYMRDLARGSYLGEDGKVHIGPTEYLQTADADHTGLPDWWSEMYGIRGESGLDDHDHDGLPNYVEYLLSEVFAFQGLRFDPTIARSVDPETPDYFIPVGSLYVGEIFTDHDSMYDDWEDLYGIEFLSRLVYDAQGDEDHDGWSNVSEMLAATDPTKTRSLGIEDEVLAAYPVPTIHVRVKIPDRLPDSVPIVVQAFRGSTSVSPDATWTTGASEDSLTKEKIIGTNPGGVRRYYLSPGSVSPGKVAILFNDQNAVTHTETIVNGVRQPDENVITGSGWCGIVNDKMRPNDSSRGDLIDAYNEIYGWIDYVTGELEIDFSKARSYGFVLGTDSKADSAGGVTTTSSHLFLDLTQAYVKFSWSAKLVKQGAMSDLYLSDADTGYVREGLNAFVAWGDMNGNGVWDVGEPYGVSRDVNVSWNSTSTDIELTDVSPVMPRIQLSSGEDKGQSGQKSGGAEGEGGETSDRGQSVSEVLQGVRDYIDITYGNGNPQIYSNMLKQVAWIEGNLIEPATLAAGSVKEQRIRIVRWLVNGVPTYRGIFDSEVILDRQIQTSVKGNLTEADVLVGESDVFDLDWARLKTDVVNDRTVVAACGNVTNVSYLVVVGDGPIGWTTSPQTNYAVKALNTVVTRRFGQRHAVPTLVSPDVAGSELVVSANPTFKWSVDCPEEEGYTAFRLQVTGDSGLVFDSGIRDVPPRIEGNYVWAAPLFAGDKTLQGQVFENKAAYTWKVSMYNAKFREDAYSEAGQFYLDVQTNGFHYGTANVAVRYFGPESTWAGGAKKGAAVIRVGAYTSPDFTGTPVAAGYVADPANADNGVAVTGKTVTANCRVIGIPSGTYYFRAYVDSNNNGVCDPWETSGYLCSREGGTASYLDPRSMTFADELGEGDLAVIYLEDADTDGDGLPDAWEYAEYGSLEEKGVELLSETGVGEFMVNTNLCGALEVQENANTPSAGLAGRLGGRLLSNAGMLALAAGAPTRGYDTFGAAIRGSVATELVEGGVKIASLDLTAGKVTIRVEAETDVKESAVLGKLLDVDGSLRVICDVKWTATLAEAPKTIKTQEITVGVTAAEIDLGDAVPESASGFFSVEIRKK